MSLVVMGAGRDFALMASDSRCTRQLAGGPPVVDDHRKKIYAVGSTAAVGLSGNDAVADAILEQLSGRPTLTPKELLGLAALGGAEIGWSVQQPNLRCSLAMIRWDEGPQAWAMASDEWFCLTRRSGCTWLPPSGRCESHVVEHGWHEGISRDDAVGLFCALISATAAVNGYVGGPVQLAVLDRDGVELTEVQT